MSAKEKIHFIAIGGSVMHNLALALHNKGYEVTGSDDEIYDPSRKRLEKAGLLPPSIGWDPSRITKDLHAVILGMHAREDNPELLKARELGVKIYSYPEFVCEQSEDKQRIVIAGSHGKTTITAMILHVLRFHKRKFDYLVGAEVEGFDTMVKLSDDAPIIIIEGDEYPCSALDKTPKFLKYKHHIGLISGIAWDHVNVYPTFEEYVKQFDVFADATPKGGALIYSGKDDVAPMICDRERPDVQPIKYDTHKHEVKNGETFLTIDKTKVQVHVIGKHNMLNLSGAKTVCSKIGITEEMFYEAIQSFKGASNRLEILSKNENTIIFKDYAHAPSKVKATTNAVKKQFDDRGLVAVLELHTFSSLNKDFLSQYNDTFSDADLPVVYYNENTIRNKKLQPLSEAEVTEAFSNPALKVYTDVQKLREFLRSQTWKKKNLLLMSSGNFDGLNLKELAGEIVKA